MFVRAASTAIALAFVLGGAAAGAQSLSLNRTGSGARAAGMANAFIAVSDDGTAASWNPAGLAPLRKPEFSLVYALGGQAQRLSGLRSPDQSFAFSNIDSSHADSSLDFASAAVPFSLAGRPVTLQAGWHRLYQLGARRNGQVLRLPLGGAGAPATLLLDETTRGHIDVASVAGAVKVTARLFLGASFDLIRGRWTDDTNLVETVATPSEGPLPRSDFAFTTSSNRIRGQGVTAGALLAYPSWNLGLVYHAPFWAPYRIRLDTRSSQTAPGSNELDDARFHFPRSMGAGVAWRPEPHWRLALDLTHDQWTTLQVQLPGRVPISVFDGLPEEFSSNRDTVSVNVGAERLFVREGSVIPVRFGFAWEPQGGADLATRDPLQFFMVAGGAGFNTNRFKFDAAVQYRWADLQTSARLSVAARLAGDLAFDALGRARTQDWRVKVSAIYRLQDTDKLRGLLRRIFG
jgi:long-subunit fatty acid transport protein